MNRATKALAPTLVLMTLIAGPAAGGPRERTKTVPYDSPAPRVGETVLIQIRDAPETRPAAGDRMVSVSIADDTGQPVSAAVHQGRHELGEVCGATETPLELVSRQPVHVHIYAGDGCSGVSAPTKGTVTFTFIR